MENRLPRRLLLLAIVLTAPACADAVGPVARAPDPAPEGPRPLAAVACTANLHAGTVECGAPGLDGPSALIIGGQDTYVTLTSGNIAVTADTFAFDLTVTNLIQQPLGTTDFTTADPEGVRVFFSAPPMGVGGTVTVANPDGTGTFTASNQPYYQYNGILEADATSAAKRWKLQFTPGTTTISFLLLVSANVPYPNGYILGNQYVLTLDPNEVRTLTGTVYSAVGNELPGETITWTSQNPALVSVSGNQATAGSSRGFTEITLDSEGRPSDFTTAVSVCQSVVVANGHSSAQSVAASDCFSAFGSNQFRPSTNYYGDLFRVALTAGQTIEITLDTGDDLDTYLVLADPTGLPVGVNDDDDEGTLGVGSRLIFIATVTGVHVFEASTFNGLDTGNYTLAVTIS
ncbi:MAG TPA: hypothetical protein VEW03_10635 [Longimicrobiaceae bacterium]|nr:hypothetical protein [Longimicrobiaceae bacterium]